MLRGESARSFGIFEHEGGVEPRLAHQAERLLKILFRLIMEAGEEVGGEPCVGEDAPDGGHTVEIPLARIFAVHRLEDAVGAALHRQMDMARYVGMGGHDVKRVVAHVLGVRRGEADTHIGRRLSHHGKQLRKTYHPALPVVVMIRVDVLAKQRGLAEALLPQILQLGKDALRVARPFAAACVGHYAVRAEIVAAAHYGDEARDSVSGQTPRHNPCVSLRQTQIHIHGRDAGSGAVEELGERQI